MTPHYEIKVSEQLAYSDDDYWKPVYTGEIEYTVLPSSPHLRSVTMTELFDLLMLVCHKHYLYYFGDSLKGLLEFLYEFGVHVTVHYPNITVKNYDNPNIR